MILRRLHLHGGVSPRSLASAAALLAAAPRTLACAGHHPRCLLHDAAGDSPSSDDHGRKPGPLTLYRNLVSQGKLTHDIYQENVASELQNLLTRLEQYEMEMDDYHTRLSLWENSREKERRKLLAEEAEDKQRDGVWIDEKRGFLDKLVIRMECRGTSSLSYYQNSMKTAIRFLLELKRIIAA